MAVAFDDSGGLLVPAPPCFPPRRIRLDQAGAPSPLDAYLDALSRSLEGQLDPALEANGILSPIGCVARAVLLEQIGADLEAAVRDLLYAGVPRERAEARAVASLGPALELGHALLLTRRNRELEALAALERSRERFWWWLEPLMPVAGIGLVVLIAALSPVAALAVGLLAEQQLGSLSIAFVPLFCSVIVGMAETLAADIDFRQHY